MCTRLHTHTRCLQKVFTALDFCHILLSSSLNLKWIKFSYFVTDRHKIPHNDRENMFLEIFDKLIKREMQKYLIYISIQPPESILWRSIESGLHMSASQHHPDCQAWRWQHHVMGCFHQHGLASLSGEKGQWMVQSTGESLMKTCLSQP